VRREVGNRKKRDPLAVEDAEPALVEVERGELQLDEFGTAGAG
jgi:hypothetical protein